LVHINIKPIGIVRSSFSPNSGDRRRVVSDLVFDEMYRPALEGVEDYSHVIVLFWMDRIPVEDRAILKVHPRGREDLPSVGVFATRGKARPNPVGLAVVELLSREENVLHVRGLDAFDKTPIVDIKPYDHYDVKDNIRVPLWWLNMTSGAQAKRGT
jgi:tRNA-Thr(GGU) m(6)t(6)A37 methyltransferase TsaA